MKLSKTEKKKKHLKIGGLKTTSTINRLFASQDIYHNNNINTKVQKQNET